MTDALTEATTHTVTDITPADPQTATLQIPSASTKPQITLYIAICSNRSLSAHFSMSLAALINWLDAQGIQYQIDHATQVNNLSNGRQRALDAVLASPNPPTHILYLDDDMAFGIAAIQNLIMRDLPVVAANYCVKSTNFGMTAVSLENALLDSRGKSGVEEVQSVGMGLVLINIAAIKSAEAIIPGQAPDYTSRVVRADTPPHFEILYSPGTPNKPAAYVTEDVYFCRKLRAAGLKIYVDHDASKAMAHIGEFAYTMDMFPLPAESAPQPEIQPIDEPLA